MARGRNRRQRSITRRELKEDREMLAARQPHRQCASGLEALDVRLENPLGRLNFLGIISNELYEAGKRYADLKMAYLQAVGAPYPFPESIGDGRLIAGPMGSPSNLYCEDIERRLRSAASALKRGGPTLMRDVEAVAVYEQTHMAPALKLGLSILAHHFRGPSKQYYV